MSEGKRLAGHSGCDIRLCTGGGRPFVRKVSAGVAYNSRLKAQCDKQRSADVGAFRRPEVLGEGETEEGLYYFDMEYVRGVSLAKRMERINVADVPPLAERLSEALECEGAQGGGADLSGAFEAKLALLEAPISSCGSAAVREAYKTLLSRDWSRVPASPCHGDLTFENVIVCDGELWLIDFLDSFAESWLMDFATVMQDVEGMWSYRSGGCGGSVRVKLRVMRDLMVARLAEFGSGILAEGYAAYLLKLLRIVPYSAPAEVSGVLEPMVARAMVRLAAAEGGEL